MSIPEWMTKQNDYSPRKDRNGFLTKTILSLATLFNVFAMKKDESVTTARTVCRTILVLGLVILSALSRNILFCGTITVALLLTLCFSRIEVIKAVLKTSLASSFLTVLIMLPSLFIYGTNSVFVIPLKVFLSVGIISLYSAATPWNKITGALQMLHFPSFIIFIMELTIHYIFILGNIARDMMVALKLRSVGKNSSKTESLSGILGTLFLKSISMAQETQQAMECRLFDGTYTRQREGIRFSDLLPIAILMSFIFLYILIE